MGIHEALKGEGYILEYGHRLGEDRPEVRTTGDRQRAGRIEWMKIDEESLWR